MARTPTQLVAGAFARSEQLLRTCRRRLIRRRLDVQSDRPNNADEWSQLYADTMAPVHALTSPIARAIAGLTEPGDVLLETGCGAATISAELATAGLKIELADFSDPLLQRARHLFQVSGLPEPRTTLCDLTRPLPWPERSVDVSWSSGVLEHWTDEELVPIVKELVRISRKRVIALVPYSGCVAYRWGKAVAEAEGTWPFGRELPRSSLRPVFEQAGLGRIQESTLWSAAGLNFLDFVDSEIRRRAVAWFDSLPTESLRVQQGYLLLTVGEIPGP